MYILIRFEIKLITINLYIIDAIHQEKNFTFHSDILTSMNKY